MNTGSTAWPCGISQEEVLEEQRKRNLLILVHSHLLEQGLTTCDHLQILLACPLDASFCMRFCIWLMCMQLRFLDSARALEKEVGSVLRKYRVCDNIDLLTVLQVSPLGALHILGGFTMKILICVWFLAQSSNVLTNISVV